MDQFISRPDWEQLQALMRKESLKIGHSVAIESYGVEVAFRTNDASAMRKFLGALDSLLAREYKLRTNGTPTHEFVLLRNKQRKFDLYVNEDLKFQNMSLAAVFARLVSDLRLTVAEHAVDKVFIHAGAVSWRGWGIIIPARSFKGKSSLTAALVRLGAMYYSDEYAVIDTNGYLRPFPKDLSLRGIKNDHVQVDHKVEEIGGRAGKKPVPLGLVVLTEFQSGTKWRPKSVKNAKGILAIINNTVGIQRSPELVLPVLAKASATAQFVSSKRGEADEAAPLILKYLEEIKAL